MHSYRLGGSPEIAVQRKPTCACGGGCPDCQAQVKPDATPTARPKLRVGAPNDRYEQEADRVARQVMRMRDSDVASNSNDPAAIEGKCLECASGQELCPSCAEKETHRRPPTASITPLIQRQGEESEEEELQAKKKAGHTAKVTPEFSATIGDLRGGGQPLPQSMRAFFEPRLAHDLGNVRVHSDARANETAQALNARAFTVGPHIVFGKAAYDPDAAEGRHLLAHELVHVVQQRQRRDTTGTVQRQEEPDRPAAVTPVTMPFTDLTESQIVSDPTGRTHGIRIERRGDDLYYHLSPPGGDVRLVPRPLDTAATPPVQDTITSVTWGGRRPFQEAFAVNFSAIQTLPYSVNIHGEGESQTLAGAFLRQPAALEVQVEGLEYEREPGILSQQRPPGSRLEDARRYHMPGSPFSMYVFPSRKVQVVEDTTGTILWSLGSGNRLRDLQVSPAGDVDLTWDDPAGVVTIRFDLRGSLFAPHGTGSIGGLGGTGHFAGQYPRFGDYDR